MSRSEKMWEKCYKLKICDESVTNWKNVGKAWQIEKCEKVLEIEKMWEKCYKLKTCEKSVTNSLLF